MNDLRDVLKALSDRGFCLSRLASKHNVLDTLRILRPLVSSYELLRIGGHHDGGYLVPLDLEGIQACFSPGVGSKANFEVELRSNFGITSYLADASVDSPPPEAADMEFEKKFLGSRLDNNFLSLDEWVNSKANGLDDGDFLMQMDIEGGEFDVLIHASEDTLNRFRIILIELHNLESLLVESTRPFVESVFRKLTKNHSVVHLHPNNNGGTVDLQGLSVPRVLEVTLHRNDRFESRIPCRGPYPHCLDRPCVLNRPDFPLPQYFYKC